MLNDHEMIPVAKPWLGEEEAAAARRAILSGWITQGPEVAKLEEEFSAFVGSKHSAAVANCTVALHLALRAVGVAPGDEVITASHSFIATANSIRYCGAVPVFVDIDPRTFNLDAAQIETAISERTACILCVHQIGMPCDLKAILAVADRHNLPVVEDAACAIGSEIHWKGEWEKIGKPHGVAACFSFHPRKLLSTGDGGMVTTQDAEIARKIKLWRHHGMSVPDTARHNADRVVFESYLELGYNYRLTDIQAAIGRVQLARIPQAVDRRRMLVETYEKHLKDLPGITLPLEPAWARSNWQSYCILLDERFDQTEVMQKLLDRGVSTRRGVMCAHREPAYAAEPWSCAGKPMGCDCPPGTCKKLPNSEHVQDHGIILPLFHEMTDEQQDRVINSLSEILR